MKPSRTTRKQVFVLTAEEKKAIACIVGAFLLGLGTMHYRAQHPRPTPPSSSKPGKPQATPKGTKKKSPARATAAPTAIPEADEDA